MAVAGSTLVFAGIVVGAYVLGRGDKTETPAVYLSWGLVGLGMLLLAF